MIVQKCCKHRNKFMLLWLVAFASLLPSCLGNPAGDTGARNLQVLALPEGDYSVEAWLNDDQIALSFLPASEIENKHPSKIQYGIYTISTREWRDMPLPPKPDDCFSGWVHGFLAKQPNDQMSFLYKCNVEGARYGSYEILYVWNRQSNALQILQKYPGYINSAFYTFSPDMTVLIQESGGGTENRLYRISRDGNVELFLPKFKRSAAPSWSANGHAIAFFGNETYPDTNSILRWDQIESLLRYPWDLYVMDADSKNRRIVVPQVGSYPRPLRWSPQGGYLAFGGVYKGSDGIWIVDAKTLKVTRAWPYAAPFDWSPNGQQLVVRMSKEVNKVKLHYPAVIDVPNLK